MTSNKPLGKPAKEPTGKRDGGAGGGDNDAVLKAVELFRDGELAKAELMCRLLVTKQPNNPDVWHVLSLIHLEKQQLEPAHQALRNAYRFVDNATKPFFERAIVAVHKAMSFSSVDQIQFGIGDAWRMLGHPVKALQAYDRALASNPQCTDAHNSKGIVQLMHDDLVGAMNSFTDAVRSRPDYGIAIDNQGFTTSTLLGRRMADALFPQDTADSYVGADAQDRFNSRPALDYLYFPRQKCIFAPIPEIAAGLRVPLYNLIRSDVPELPSFTEADIAGNVFQPIMQSAFALQRYNRAQAEGILSSKEVFKFTFVRNPYDRIVASYFKNFIYGRFDENNWGHIRPVLHKALGEDASTREDYVTFREFVEYLRDVDEKKLDVRWRPMFQLVDPLYMDLIGKLETFESDVKIVEEKLKVSLEFEERGKMQEPKRILDTKRGAFAEAGPDVLESLGAIPVAAHMFDTKLEAVIQKRYEVDFVRFGYPSSITE
ncbi:MAG: sulfotransferase family 2 domain-containing protein [Cyanobacteria bacterium]|nr:sulfotransferase family 2 domain-containing protein [Cyanobacteriota bacterium]